MRAQRRTAKRPGPGPQIFQMQLDFDRPQLRAPAEPTKLPIKRPATESSKRQSRTYGPSAEVSPKPLAVPIKVACAYLGIKRSTVYNLMKCEKLAWQKIGARRVVLFASMETLLGMTDRLETSPENGR
jgi:hypothetical protein